MRFIIGILLISSLGLNAQNKQSSLSIEMGLNKSYIKLYNPHSIFDIHNNPIDPKNLGLYHINDKHTGYYFSIQYKSRFKKIYYLTGLRITNKKFDFIQDKFFDSVVGSVGTGWNFSYIEIPLLIRFYNRQLNNSGIAFYGGMSINYLIKQLWGSGNAYFWNSFDNPAKSEPIPLIFGPNYKENHLKDKPKIAFSIYAEYKNDFYLGKNNALTFGYTRDLMPAMEQQYRLSINHRIYEAIYYPVFGYAYMAYKYQLSVPKFLKKK